MLDADDPLIRVAVFGERVKQFLESDIGDFLLTRARAQSEFYTRKLKDADPFNAEQIVAYQFKIKVAEEIIGWLAEAIDAGLQAQEHREAS